MEKALISIIVPVYNIENYLDKCIKSLVNQTYENLEILLIDDGSTDCSGQKCDEWAQKDSRIQVIHKPNGGVSAARNRGLKEAKGEYIGFVDGDDYIDKHMYEQMYQCLCETKAEACFCNIYYAKDDEVLSESELNFEKVNLKKIVMQTMFEKNNQNFPVWNKLMKKECIETIQFDETIKIYEDGLFNLECLDKIEKIAFVKEHFYYYVVSRKNSALHEFNIEKHVTVLDAMIKMNHILAKNQIEARFLQQADFIGKVYLYEQIAKRKNLSLDFTTYKKVIKQYLKKGLLKQKIGFKNKLKIIGAVYFTKQYVKFTKARKDEK